MSHDLAVKPSADSSGFAQGYRTLPVAVDEMIEADGSLRPHWHMFVKMLDDLGPAELRRRWEQARRLIHDNGITHNVYGDPAGLDRPWNLDFIPLLIPSVQWDGIHEGLIQRARLLDRLLADLYGPANCVAAGILPPELLHANAGYLRACHGVLPPQDRWLHLYAADVVRTPDGRFEVLSDRTQAPSGAGYTLENRIVLSRVLPTIFRQLNVQRLAPFFLSLRQTLASLAPANRDNPRVVLLTPGPYNETYFEHAYLARYLGYALVQGNDLTVRDAKVYLKTLGGLQRVDVILRRVDDDFCDPLELLPTSFLGVPGLLEAVREGNVAVTNALGSGVLQGPGFLPFLPALCEFLLGEPLKMPSVQTWWCGDLPACSFVLANLNRLVIKPAFPVRRFEPIFGADLTREQLADWTNRIKARPFDFVAQEPASPCTAPTQLEGGIQPRRFVVRSFLCASGDGYAVMPGGLTRITHSSDSLVVSLQKGGGSKDTWILADGPVSQVTLLTPASQPVDLSRGGGDLPSRIADDLYWLGRYIQRAEATVRTARGVLSRLIEQSNAESGRALGALCKALLGAERMPSNGQFDRDLITSVLGVGDSDGLRGTIDAAHRLARLLRDRISIDSWRILQNIERAVTVFKIDPVEPWNGVAELLDGLISSFAAFVGLSTDSMTRGQAWRFLDMGHRVERAQAVMKLLRDTLVAPVTRAGTAEDAVLLEAVLEIADSSLTYRRRYLTHLEAHAVVDLLLADETNPRAVAFQINAIGEHLAALPREHSHPHRNPDRQTALKLRTALQLADIESVCQVTGDRRDRLDGLLADSLDKLGTLAESIGQIYFAHAAIPRRLLVNGNGQDSPS